MVLVLYTLNEGGGLQSTPYVFFWQILGPNNLKTDFYKKFKGGDLNETG